MITSKTQFYVEYSLAIRRNAESGGFMALAKANDEESILHYGSHNAKGRGAGRGIFPDKRTTMGKATHASYAWNGEAGCVRGEDDCRFLHIYALSVEPNRISGISARNDFTQ